MHAAVFNLECQASTEDIIKLTKHLSKTVLFVQDLQP